MSIYSSQNNINRIESDIANLEKQLASEVKKESDLAQKRNQVENSINRYTSINSLKSKQNQITRYSVDIAKVIQKKADLSKKIVDKKKQRTKLQEQLERELKTEKTRSEQAEKKRQKEELNHQRLITSEIRKQKEIITDYNAETTSLPNKNFDFFISHASEDKEEFVRPLADKLTEKGLKIWYDEFQLKVGDSLRRSIDKGLINSKYAVVVLSSSFFKKNWTQYELDGLVTKEMNGIKVILPIWHKVSKDEVISYSLTLADKVALNTSLMSIDEIANELIGLIQ